MKTILIAFLATLSVIPLRADPAKGVGGHAYNMPKACFREVLEIVAKIADKQVIVTSEDDLKIQTSLVLPGPVSSENARKVISALLMLEGYVLVESGQELHLKRVLTKEQCDALNKALERPRAQDDRPLPRQRAGGRAEEAPKLWVIVRPAKE
jgi:type II secretory pathway component GspD/PulD (secretin)